MTNSNNMNNYEVIANEEPEIIYSMEDMLIIALDNKLNTLNYSSEVTDTDMVDTIMACRLTTLDIVFEITR